MSDSERTTIEGRIPKRNQDRPDGRYAVHNKRSGDPQNRMPAGRPPNPQNPSEWGDDRTVVDDEGNSVSSYISSDASSVLQSFATDDPQRASNPTLEELTVDDSSVALPAVNPLEIVQMSPDAMAKLVVIDGNDLGRKFDLNGQKVTIGRGLDNSVVLTDIAVSRKHLSLEFHHGRYVLIDMGSGNGTLVNGELTRGTYELIDSDFIEIGKTKFRFDHLATRGETRSKPAQSAADLPRVTAEAPKPPPSPALPLHGPGGPGGPGGQGAARQASAMPRPEPPLHLDEPRLPPPFREDSVADQPQYSLPPPPAPSLPPAGNPFGPGNLPAPRAPEPPRRTNAMPAAPKTAAVKAQAPAPYPGLSERGQRYPLPDEQAESYPTTKYGGEAANYGGEAGRTGAPSPAVSPFMQPGAQRYQGSPLLASPSAQGKRRLRVPLIAAAVVLVLLGGGIAFVLAFTDLSSDAGSAAPGAATTPSTKNEPAPDSPPDTEKPDVAAADPGPTVAKLEDQGNDGKPAADPGAAGKQEELEIEPDVVPAEAAEPAAQTATPAESEDEPQAPRGPNVQTLRKRADALYRQRKFDAAASTLREAAEATGPKIAKDLRERASLYESVGADLNKASGATPTAALTTYKRALGNDRSAGGGLSGYITSQMGTVAAKAAKQHFDARRYEAAMSAADDAQRYGAGNEVSGVRKALEDKAQELYKDAMRKKATSPDEAQSLFERILKMVPPSSEVYKKAYKQVNR